MSHLALSAIGRDRPGIVAAVSKVLLDHECNVEDSSMAILRGHFTMMLIVSAPDRADLDRLREALGEVRDQLALEAVTLSEVAEISDQGVIASHIVSVYGIDHPGILHAVASALASDQVDIVDLTTRVLEEEGARPLYTMILEVAVPDGVDAGELERKLGHVCQGQDVDLSFGELERDIL
jgi:glycine cleavage system transcriptional repressor